MREELANQALPLESCATLLASTELQDQIHTIIQDSVDNTVARLNISAEKIYQDFIQLEDNDTKQAAINIVKGLKASHRYRDTIEEQYPDADYIRIEYYQGSETDNEGAYPDAWYRKVAVWLPDGFSSEEVKMDDTLTEVMRIIYLRTSGVISFGEGKLSFTKDIYSYGGDGTDYTCINNERFTIIHNGIRYGLSNDSPTLTASNATDCVNNNFGYGTYRYFYFDYTENDINFHTRFTVNNSNPSFSALAGWVDMSGRSDELEITEFINFISAMPYHFDSTVINSQFFSWYKRSTDDREVERVITTQFNDGSWQRQTYRTDGTIQPDLIECSLDGVTWSTTPCVFSIDIVEPYVLGGVVIRQGSFPFEE